MLSYTEL